MPNTVSSGSGDDHLLTAHADEEFTKIYHDNRAFQFNNNNSLNRKSGKNMVTKPTNPKNDKNALDVLDVVIVHKGYRNLKDDGELINNICCCKQQMLTTQLLSEPRKRHNATQTPTSLINWEHRGRKIKSHTPSFCCDKHCTCLVPTKKTDYCNLPKVRRCQHHCQFHATSTSRCCCFEAFHPYYYSRNPSIAILSGNKQDGEKATAQLSNWPICAKDSSFKRHKRCSSGRNNPSPHMHQHHKKHCSSVSHLPNTFTKSSLDSSEDQNHRLSSSCAMQEVAIEIDAATMTEDNTTTATSDFGFKLAEESALAPIIRAPIHIDSDGGGRGKRLKRKPSMNSNTTAETDELSNEDIMDKEMCGNKRDGRYYCHCYNTDGNHTLPVGATQNECVKIKRKRFIAADDYCSSCSRCSSCSWSHVHSSSCSSFEEWPLEGRYSVHSAPVGSNAFKVSADCHHYYSQRQNSQTSTDDLERQADEFSTEVEEEVHPQSLVLESTDSSARTSRRSSMSISFCSCNSNTCCYCTASYEDSYTGHMCTARDATIASLALGKLGPFEGEEGHSSTLTPLTNPSSVVTTPGDEGDVTIRSLSNALSEDTSSQSHSAEYFSLSSTNQVSLGTPLKLPTNNKHLSTTTDGNTGGVAIPNVAIIDTTANTNTIEGDDANSHKGRKPCKHYSKHHRHKRVDSPVHSYL